MFGDEPTPNPSELKPLKIAYGKDKGSQNQESKLNGFKKPILTSNRRKTEFGEILFGKSVLKFNFLR